MIILVCYLGGSLFPPMDLPHLCSASVRHTFQQCSSNLAAFPMPNDTLPVPNFAPTPPRDRHQLQYPQQMSNQFGQPRHRFPQQPLVRRSSSVTAPVLSVVGRVQTGSVRASVMSRAPGPQYQPCRRHTPNEVERQLPAFAARAVLNSLQATSVQTPTPLLANTTPEPFTQSIPHQLKQPIRHTLPLTMPPSSSDLAVSSIVSGSQEATASQTPTSLLEGPVPELYTHWQLQMPNELERPLPHSPPAVPPSSSDTAVSPVVNSLEMTASNLSNQTLSAENLLPADPLTHWQLQIPTNLEQPVQPSLPATLPQSSAVPAASSVVDSSRETSDNSVADLAAAEPPAGGDTASGQCASSSEEFLSWLSEFSTDDGIDQLNEEFVSNFLRDLAAATDSTVAADPSRSQTAAEPQDAANVSRTSPTVDLNIPELQDTSETDFTKLLSALQQLNQFGKLP